MARLHVALPFDRTSFQRFIYIADCVARDVTKENEEAKKAASRRASGFNRA
jgi:hypothetical protein